MALRATLYLSLGALVGFCAGWFAKPHPSARPALAWTEVLAMPRWQDSATCAQPTDQEREAFERAVESLETVRDDGDILWLDIGAERFLAAGIVRFHPPKIVRVCAPPMIYERASDVITKAQLLSRGRIVEYGLVLARKLPHDNPYIASVVGASAFNDNPQESDILSQQDIRPFARTVLADIGQKAAANYGEVAAQLMSGKDSLGTGAAQVAVAAEYPGALASTQAMMERILVLYRPDTAVPVEETKRLYELAYAISFGGADARNYTSPIKDLMTRKVQVVSPPFGILKLWPVEMCEVLKGIDGASAIQPYQFCTDSPAPERTP